MLTELFASKERLKLLYEILYSDESTVRQLAEDAQVSVGLASGYLKTLEHFNLVVRAKNKYFVRDSSRSRALKVLLNLERIELDKLDYDWTNGIGLFGSWARGENMKGGDLDVWVKVESYPSEFELAKLQRRFTEMTGSETNLLVLTPKKLEELRARDKPFYHALLRDSIVLRGEGIE
jgi:predicted nucleotidyltransferase